MRCCLVVGTALALALVESNDTVGNTVDAAPGSSLKSTSANLLKGSSLQHTTRRRRLGQSNDKEFPDADSSSKPSVLSEASAGNSLDALLDQYSPESVTPHPAATTASTTQYVLLPPAPTPTFYDGSSHRHESDDLSKEESSSVVGRVDGEDTSTEDDDDDDDDNDEKSTSTSGGTAPSQTLMPSQPPSNSSSETPTVSTANSSSSSEVQQGVYREEAR